MSLQSRKELFWKMSSHFEHKKLSDLIVVHTIDKQDFISLRHACQLFLEASAERAFMHVEDMEECYEKETIKCITPNGLIVPKCNSSLEFNLLCQRMYSILQKLNIANFASCWNVPPNLRLKKGKIEKYPRSTEYPHSDAWVGECSRNVTIMIPLFGDIKNNYVKYFDTPDDFEEDWLSPLPSYVEGQELAKKYKPIEYSPKLGEMVLADFSTVHYSYRSENAGIRISIDTIFGLKEINEDTSYWQWRGQRVKQSVINTLGMDYLLVFPDKTEEQVDSQEGRRQAVNCQVKKLI